MASRERMREETARIEVHLRGRMKIYNAGKTFYTI